MAVSINFIDKGTYVIAEPDGTISSHEEMTAYAKDIIRGAARLDRKKVLIRGQNITMQLSAYDTIAFAETMDEISLALGGYRIAVVTAEQSAKSRSMIETALVNRSVEYRVCTSEECALGWLRLD
ncbi:hypothetical protein [Pseudodesulfovibrio sp. zrk46]|uniref:hypothetical protein n=1 Tax=Pseudodesulfovibrio sp. zrk46 TaxID=2725288 RepID=UPI001449CE8B|nr:hypothetical protein [Pseudodesulfovibrio sp. zrk46]QJB55782.1 hypothetical protein HFN16_04905 [Pseudodesulfovibrio sp. zrk46]